MDSYELEDEIYLILKCGFFGGYENLTVNLALKCNRFEPSFSSLNQ